MRQRLQQCVVVSPWSAEAMFGRIARTLERDLPGIDAFIVDDTGFPKKGTHSVGVARQYSGTGPSGQLPDRDQSPSRRRVRQRLYRHAAVSARHVDERPRPL